MVQKQAAVPVLTPTGTEQPAPQDLGKFQVKVWYGANEGTANVMPGQTVKEVLASPSLKEECGYGAISENDPNLFIVVNHEKVNGNYELKEGDMIEVLKKAGEKA